MEKENKVLINHGDIISLCTSKEIPDSQGNLLFFFLILIKLMLF